jgi:hypothetical protein
MEKECYLMDAKNATFPKFKAWLLRNFPKSENHIFAEFEDMVDLENLPEGNETSVDEHGNYFHRDCRYADGKIYSGIHVVAGPEYIYRLEFDLDSGVYYGFCRV